MLKIPEFIKNPLRHLKNNMRTILYYGKGKYCPVCEKSSRQFLPFGVTAQRKNAQCVHCGSLERHLFLWIYLSKKTDMFNDLAKRMLHVAPESCLESKFRKQLGVNYLTADLSNPGAMIKMDIADIQYPDEVSNLEPK